MDQLEGGLRGWDVKDGEDPFDKSDQDITEQATEFCYRCGNLWSGNWWEIEGFDFPKQLPKNLNIQHIKDPYFVSSSNLKLIDKSKISKIKLHIIED
jgi:hypothetical protein